MVLVFFFSSRRRHTRWNCDWSSDVCSSDLIAVTRHRDEMAGRAAVDARGVGLHALQQRGPRMPALLVAELAPGSFNAMVLHLGLLHRGSAQASADRGAMELSGTLLNGITTGR